MERKGEGGNLKWITGKTSWQYDLLDFANAPKGDRASFFRTSKSKVEENTGKYKHKWRPILYSQEHWVISRLISPIKW